MIVLVELLKLDSRKSFKNFFVPSLISFTNNFLFESQMKTHKDFSSEGLSNAIDKCDTPLRLFNSLLNSESSILITSDLFSSLALVNKSCCFDSAVGVAFRFSFEKIFSERFLNSSSSNSSLSLTELN